MIFAVKGRQSIISEGFRDELEKYICGIVRNKNHKVLSIYCMPDHTHLLVGLNPSQAIADLVKEIKTSSSNLIKMKKWVTGNFYWQEGYAAFSYSKSQLNSIINYIVNQPDHHKIKTFKEEYILFLEKNEIKFEEKYLFEFYENVK